MAATKTKRAASVRKTATSKKPAKKSASARKAAPAGKKPRKKTPAEEAKPVKKAAPAKKAASLDLSAFPPESIAQNDKRLCLACVLDVFTRHLGLSPKTAHIEIKRYTPSLDELRAPEPVRPYFEGSPKSDACPYCGSPAKWHATIPVHRIESGKATDTLRRELVKSLSDSEFTIVEEKATQQAAFFEWLDKISEQLDLDDPRWLRDVSRHYLSRKAPKTDWQTQFASTHAIRRSRRLETGWEVDQGRLFLAPMLFDELLLVQYLVSRSHRAGGLTLEGRYTLPELFSRLRHSGYLRSVNIHTPNPSEAFEQLLAYLGGGETSLKFYYIVDRRNLLERAKSLKEVRVPRPRPVA